MNTKHNNPTILNDKSNHYKAKLRDYSCRNQFLLSNNIKLKNKIFELSNDNKKLKSTIEELKKTRRKQKWFDTFIRSINYIGVIIISTIISYGVSTNATETYCTPAVVIAYILAVIKIILYAIAGGKISSFLSIFKDLILDVLQSFLPLLFAIIILWFKKPDFLSSYLNDNMELMTALIVIFIIDSGLMIFVMISSGLTMLVIYLFITVIKKNQTLFSSAYMS